MKQLLALLVCLSLAVSANAVTDDFNDGDISDWTYIQADTSYGAGGLLDQGGGDYCYYKPDINICADILTKAHGVVGNDLVFEVAIEPNGSWRPLQFGLCDNTGAGLWLNAYAGDTYIEMGVGDTSDYAASFNTKVTGMDTPKPAGDIILQYVVDLTANTVVAKNNGAVQFTADISGLSLPTMTDMVINTTKRIYIDDIGVTPEPATMVLLSLGGLALIRRR